ncbi:hypothetical protein WG68_08640 [Arsukibacterium ikkense]|uniref:Uncharacterized protein n=1 Tax=Arsukibacterium ikkense TaxID=336831 RepID=A0A0M2V9C5_9GAMM|nr:hypothetical protein [Arsukibacterium ikkense]KKO45773.1 hypothetical protein WG68_08640 [Arsukibacterium ikkense]
MLIGFFIGAFIGTFFGGWSPLIFGCAGAMLGLHAKWERELAPYKARERKRERQRQADKRRSAKARGRKAKIAGGSALAATAVASQWPKNDEDISTDDLFSSVADDDSAGMINPATGLPMLNSCFDAGGNAFGCSSDDWDSTNTHDSSQDSSFDSNTFDSFSDTSFDDSFSSFNDDW